MHGFICGMRKQALTECVVTSGSGMHQAAEERPCLALAYV